MVSTPTSIAGVLVFVSTNSPLIVEGPTVAVAGGAAVSVGKSGVAEAGISCALQAEMSRLVAKSSSREHFPMIGMPSCNIT
jgi:hypothetical protein